MGKFVMGVLLSLAAASANADVTAFDMAKAFEDLGAKLVLHSQQGGKLTYDGRDQWIAFGLTGDEPAKVASVGFGERLMPKRRVSQGQLAWAAYEFYQEPQSVAYFVWIDGTVSSRWSMDVGPDDSARAVAASVLKQLAEYDRYKLQAEFEPVPAGWTPTAKDIAQDRVIEVWDERDMHTLIYVWGWQSRKSYGGSGPEWAWRFPILVDGVDVWMSAEQGEKIRLSLRFSADLPNPADWLKKANAHKRWGSIEPWQVQKSYSYGVDVDTASGMTPRALKKVVERFAREAKKVLKETNGKAL